MDGLYSRTSLPPIPSQNLHSFLSPLLLLPLPSATFSSTISAQNPNRKTQFSAMKKVVLKLDLPDDKAKKKALKLVSTLPGIDSIAMDMKEKKLTVIGAVDPVTIVSKLRKFWPADIVFVGPAVEPKKEEAKKEEGKKEEDGKKEEGKKEEEKKGEAKKEEEKKEGEEKKNPNPNPNDAIIELVKAYRAYNPHLTTQYYVQSMEENPNACAIC